MWSKNITLSVKVRTIFGKKEVHETKFIFILFLPQHLKICLFKV